MDEVSIIFSVVKHEPPGWAALVTACRPDGSLAEHLGHATAATPQRALQLAIDALAGTGPALLPVVGSKLGQRVP